MIYLDNNATTQIDPLVIEAMLPFLTKHYGNPSSPYGPGRQVAAALNKARECVSALIGCDPVEIIFTSCGTESNNAAISSALKLDPDRRHIVMSAVEHSAVLKHGEALARAGHPVTRIPVDAAGRIDPGAVAAAITEETAIVSVMWANNETGMLFPVRELASLAHEKGALFHADAVQVPGKLPINVCDIGADFLSFSGHKLHAPKGVGALYACKRCRFHPYLIGGGQEGGKRGGTENVASIVGFGKAAELALLWLDHEDSVVRLLRDTFESRILSEVEGTSVNGDTACRLPNTTSISFDAVEGEGLLVALDRRGVCASAGSACTTGSLTPSHVLTAMGLSADRARSTLRFSFSRFNSEEEIAPALEAVASSVERLRELRPASASPVAMAR